MTSVELKHLGEVVKAFQDPKLTIYYLLLAKRLKRLVDRIRGRSETYYYPA